MYFHMDSAIAPLEIYAYKACPCMPGDVAERFLDNAVERCTLDTTQFIDFGESTNFEVNGDPCSLREVSYVGLEGGNKPYVVQYRRKQFVSESMDDFHRLFYKPLCA